MAGRTPLSVIHGIGLTRPKGLAPSAARFTRLQANVANASSYAAWAIPFLFRAPALSGGTCMPIDAGGLSPAR